jgi:cation-transporting ATPase E
MGPAPGSRDATGPTAAGRDGAGDVERGLSPPEVTARIEAGLANTAPPRPGRTLSQILRANVLTRFNAILGVLFVVVAVVGPAVDGLFGVVLVANTAIGVGQELRARRTLDRLAILTAPRAHVVRQGVVTSLPVSDLVLDDIVELRPGDQVAVDARVVRADGLEIDESLLSGEALPIPKTEGDPVLSGSFVVAGTGRARASAVGGSAYAASLQARARQFRRINSELVDGTNRLLQLVTWVMIPTGTALVLSQLLRSNESLADSLRGTVAGVGAMVPEGLVLLTSIAFAVGALRLARRRVLVQELPAIEGLARVDVLCIDKTGTLTEPGMRLERIVPLAALPADEIAVVVGALAGSDPAPNATMRALSESSGDSSGESAGHSSGESVESSPWSVASRVPFSSARKWSAVTFEGGGSWVLGAADQLATDLGAPEPTEIARHAAAGRRVLMLASAPATVDGPELPADITPVGLLVLDEQLRADAPTTVRYLLDEGIAIKVISGDAPLTVEAVAERVGIPGLSPACDAGALPEAGGELAEAIMATTVVGRVKPEQKLAIVRALQDAGHVVAMVGDGVNDVQALKEADIGIAMGTGSDASRAVARVVLLDSSFAAVPSLLGEGRRVIANIERVANLFVTKTVYAAVLAAVVTLAGVAYPFFPRHLTVVSTLTIGVPGFLLALAPGAPRASPGFVHRVLTFTLPAGLCAAASAFACYAIARASDQTTAAQARTAAMLGLFAVGLWVLGLVARPLDPARMLLIVAMGAGLALMFAIPPLRQAFSLDVPPPSVTWATVGVSAASIVVLTLWRHWWARRTGCRTGPGASPP